MRLLLLQQKCCLVVLIWQPSLAIGSCSSLPCLLICFPSTSSCPLPACPSPPHVRRPLFPPSRFCIAAPPHEHPQAKGFPHFSSPHPPHPPPSSPGRPVLHAPSCNVQGIGHSGWGGSSLTGAATAQLFLHAWRLLLNFECLALITWHPMPCSLQADFTGAVGTAALQPVCRETMVSGSSVKTHTS